MRHQLLAVVAVAAALISGQRVQADVVAFAFSGAGVSGSGLLTYGPNTVVGDPVGSYAITDVSGTFSDSTLGLSGVSIVGIVPIAPLDPVKGGLFPNSFSSLAVTNPSHPGEGVSYDNLLYPGGSPNVCDGYPGAGGYLDVYGVMFKLSNGYIVDLFSNGTWAGGPPLSYGAVVIDATSTAGTNTIVHYQADGIASAIPEPTSAVLLGAGLLGLAAWQGRKRRAG